MEDKRHRERIRSHGEGQVLASQNSVYVSFCTVVMSKLQQRRVLSVSPPVPLEPQWGSTYSSQVRTEKRLFFFKLIFSFVTIKTIIPNITTCVVVVVFLFLKTVLI